MRRDAALLRAHDVVCPALPRGKGTNIIDHQMSGFT